MEMLRTSVCVESAVYLSTHIYELIKCVEALIDRIHMADILLLHHALGRNQGPRIALRFEANLTCATNGQTSINRWINFFECSNLHEMTIFSIRI